MTRRRLVAYCSAETHTWIQKAADLSGLGTSAVRWIAVDAERRMDVGALARQIDVDREQRPAAVSRRRHGGHGQHRRRRSAARDRRDLQGRAICGSTSTARTARRPPSPPARPTTSAPWPTPTRSPSIPHKWLYAPLEAGCALVRDPAQLRGAFAYTPAYYHFDSGDAAPPPNYYEYGPQNSRGFRALKVWLALQPGGPPRLRRR